jgi:hypothetical protein
MDFHFAQSSLSEENELGVPFLRSSGSSESRAIPNVRAVNLYVCNPARASSTRLQEA